MVTASLQPHEQFAAAAAEDPLVRHVRNARSVAMLTGAGISAPSGVPTFRGPTGLYESENSGLPPLEAVDLAERPEEVFAWAQRMAVLLADATPNKGHLAITTAQQGLAEDGGGLTLATMNLDDLHEQAGAAVGHLHGQIHRERCDCCGTLSPAQFDADRACHCGERVRPDITLFGENVDRASHEAMYEAVAACEVFYAVGVSGMTATPWNLANRARCHRAITVLVCVDPDLDYAALFDIVIDDSAENLSWYLPYT